MRLLSIVIPALNEEKYLPILLNSFLNQSEKNFEIVVVDGKSDDKTVEKANEFKDRLNLRVVTSDKRNLSHQRNMGAKEASGDYVAFLDADFIVKDNFVKSCFWEAEKTNADIIIPFSYPITSNPLWKIYFALINILSVVSTFLGKPFGNGPGNIIKKAAFLKTSGYNERVFVFEDQHFFQTAKNTGLKIKHTNKIKMYFSLRRLKKGGLLGYFYFNIYAALHLIFKGPIYKKFYDYKMGGQNPKEE